VAKFRAARRLWARLMKERFDASDESARLRFHTQTGGSTLTAQQPLNNVVRVTVQALAAVLGGTQSLHTNGYDEALALPSAEAATLALRTQQILAHESGVTGTVDPLGGSYYVEALTQALEEKALAYLDRILQAGGASNAIELMQEEVHRAAYAHQLAIEAGDRTVVGLNAFQAVEESPRMAQPDFHELEAMQRSRLGDLRTARDARAVADRLAGLSSAAVGSENLMPHILAAARARATLGEISDTLRSVWGTYTAV
jgi:methylmalonyl-CoA mutase N-terminal domain/subunit